MAEAFVRFEGKQPRVPGEVFGQDSVGAHEVLTEFKVRVVNAGCYAILVRLFAFSRAPNIPLVGLGNRVVATMLGADLDCYCFQAQEEKAFFTRGSGDPPKDTPPLKPRNADATPLKPLTGKWPESDFPSDNLELFVEVNVYVCKLGGCTPSSCVDVKLDTVELEGLDPVGSVESPVRGNTKIVNGKTPEKIRDAIIEGAKDKAKEAVFKSALPSFDIEDVPVEYPFALLDARIRNLERRVRQQRLEIPDVRKSRSENSEY